MAGLVLLLAGPAASAQATPDATTVTAASERLDVTVGGWAENVLPLPNGDVLVSNLSRGLVQRIDGGTHEITTVAEVAGPGGMAVDGDTLYVVTGNSPLSVITGEGGVLALDLRSGERRTVVDGLGEANGLARLPGGDLVYTVTLGAGSGVHRVAGTSLFVDDLDVLPDGRIVVSTVTGRVVALNLEV